MSESSSDKNTNQYLIYLIVFIVSLSSLIGGLLSKGENAASIWPFFFSELGIAGIIALIITFTIEKFTKEQHTSAAEELIEKINTNLFYAIYKRYIPSSVLSEVEDCLMKCNVVRSEYSIDYALDRIENDKAETLGINEADSENHLLCSIFSTYKLKNITDKDIKEKIEIHIELPIDQNLHNQTKISSVTVDGIDLSDDELRANIRRTDTHLVFCRPESIPAKGHVTISSNCVTLKRNVDMEVWASRFPSNGLMLRVTAPEGVIVAASANHSNALTKESINNGKVSIWKLNKGVFPFQSVLFWWKAD